MSNKIKLAKRGAIEIENSKIKCFLGKDNNIISSEDLWKSLKDNKVDNYKIYYNLGDEQYIIYYPIPQKNISIILSNGTKYKSTIYFEDDIKNIIFAFGMENACYLQDEKYVSFSSENHYGIFLLNEELSEIKDIQIESIKYTDLKDKYENFQIKNTIKLGEINQNIHLYSKIDKIGEEEYFMTFRRSALNLILDEFIEKKERNEITDVIYGMFGNYASGKSFYLINYNYISKFPSIYLNLKALKNALETRGFTDMLNNEIIILFKKLNQPYDEYQKFISKLLPYENKKLENLLLSIIEEIKLKKAVIIIDQYQDGIFNDDNFIQELKKILFAQNSKIKVIISSSLNNGPIRTAYLNIILKLNNSEGEKKKAENKTNDYIPYKFMKRLVDGTIIKRNIEKQNLTDEHKFNEIIRLFNYLPLYYTLCTQNKDNLDNFVEETKERLNDKIKIFYKHNINLQIMDKIRKMIDNEISAEDLKVYSEYIPFKYFYVENIEKKLFLKTHFPIINEVWNEIIMKETVQLFDGEIKYDGNVVGSLLELNIINNIKNKNIPLNIDSFIKVDAICNFDKIIEGDTSNFKNKNIFITQKNENAAYFDLAYLQGKNADNPKLAYIQVKKSLTKNKVNIQQMEQNFQENKKKIEDLFGSIPKEINLVYISLINNKIKKAMIEHDNYKKYKNKKVSDLSGEVLSLVYSINKIDNFCSEQGILLYYYEPNTHLFYQKKNLDFIESKLDLFTKLDQVNIIFHYSKIISQLEENTSTSTTINLNYKKFLEKKRKKNENFSYMIDDFDMGIVFKFANDYFNNVFIIKFIDLTKSNLSCEFNNLSNRQAVICLKKTDKKYYKIVSFIYDYRLIKIDNDELEFYDNISLVEDNDYLVIIGFESINKKLISLLNKKK